MKETALAHGQQATPRDCECNEAACYGWGGLWFCTACWLKAFRALVPGVN